MNKKVVIGLHGKPRSGKDTVCNRLLCQVNLLRYGPSVQVKKATAAMFNIPEEYLYDDTMKDAIDPYWKISYREMAQKVGNESSRKIFGEDFWLQHVDYFLNYKLPSIHQGIILADIRYANEVQWVKSRGGVVIFIHRENRPSVSNEGHEAEKGLDFSLADYVINNNGSLGDLYMTVDNLYSTLRHNSIL